MTYTTAIILNNQGAQNLQNGRFRMAARLLHVALDTINAAMEVDHSDDNDDDDEAMHSIKNNTSTFEWSSEARYTQHEDTEETFVYRRALIILPTRSQRVRPSQEGYAEETAAIVYNLALAYHLYGLENHSQFLRTALTLYEFTLEAPGTRMHDHFDLAALNNLGQIHHEIFDFERSLQCFAHAFEVMNRISRPMDACDYKGFLLNLTLEASSTAPSA